MIYRPCISSSLNFTNKIFFIIFANYLICSSKYFCFCLNSSTHNGITFSPNYDMEFPPSPSPVLVSLKINVQTVSPIQSTEMEYRVNMRWTLSWIDPRISLQIENVNSDDDDDDCAKSDDKYVILPSSLASKIWIPDPFITNAKYSGIKSFDKKLANLVLFPNHTLAFTMILNATVACAMNFEFYPLDIQNCPMIIQSFAYNTERVNLVWDSDPGAFSIKPTRLIQFMVVESKLAPYKRYVQIPQLGNVSQLVATFRFERLISSHIVQSFIPSSLVVTLSWFNFWLELDVTAARGFLLMTCILFLQIHLLGLKLEFPPVAYVKMIDVWVFGCIFCVFSALAEFILVKVLFQVTEEERRENQVWTLAKIRLEERQLEQYELDSFDAANIICNNTKPQQSPTISQHNPYAAFWLWQELQVPPNFSADLQNLPPEQHGSSVNRPRQIFAMAPYRKRRLGSVVLSGRSVATTHLPLVQKRLCFGKSLPLVWESKSSGGVEKRKVLWHEIDGWAKVLFPPFFAMFAIGFWAVLLTHAAIV